MNKELVKTFFMCEKNAEKKDRVGNSVLFLHVLSRLFKEFAEGHSKEFSLTGSDLDVLLTLDHLASPLSPTLLYERMLFSSGGMTKILKKLESRGLIQRIPNPDDKRSLLVDITEEGREVASKIFDKMIFEENEIFTVLEDEELQIMQKALEKIFNRIIS